MNTLLGITLYIAPKLASLILSLAFLLWVILVAIASHFSHYRVNANVRYGYYILTYNDFPLFGIDFSGVFTDTVLILNSPLGWS